MLVKLWKKTLGKRVFKMCKQSKKILEARGRAQNYLETS